MIIGERLRALREEKKFSQGEIEKRTGLLRCYTSRVENGHTVPSVETLEKFARALEVPMYQLFYEGEEPPKPPKLPNLLKRKTADDIEWGRACGKECHIRSQGRNSLALISFQFRKTFSRDSCGAQRQALFSGVPGLWP
jgi:transcriptional regulator with XRE-family HTH domain